VHGALTQPPISRQTSLPATQVHRGRVSARLQIKPTPEQSLATSQVPSGGNPVAAVGQTRCVNVMGYDFKS
jgi:hypothetical protein